MVYGDCGAVRVISNLIDARTSGCTSGIIIDNNECGCGVKVYTDIV